MFLRLYALVGILSVVSSCGFHPRIPQPVRTLAPAWLVMVRASDAPATFARAAVDMLGQNGFSVITNDASATQLYSLSFRWRRQTLTEHLASGNFVISLFVTADYSLRTPTNDTRFLPNKLLVLRTRQWRFHYVQSQTDTRNSAQYAFESQNGMLDENAHSLLLQQLRGKLLDFITATASLTLEDYNGV